MKNIEISHDERTKQLLISYALGALTVFGILTATEPGLRHRIVDVGDYIASGKSPEPELIEPIEPIDDDAVELPKTPTPTIEAGGVAAPPQTPEEYYGTGTMLPPLDPDEPDPFLEPEPYHDAATTSDMKKLEKLPMLMSEDEIESLIAVECSGDFYLRGDGGKAYGPLQIWKGYLNDVNETYGTSIAQDELLGNSAPGSIIRGRTLGSRGINNMSRPNHTGRKSRVSGSRYSRASK